MRYKVIITYKNGKVVTRDNNGEGYLRNNKLLRLITRLNEDEDIQNIKAVEFDPGKEAH